MVSSTLTPEQRYAAAALFGLALRQAQIDGGDGGGHGDPSLSWTHQSCGLLRPIFQLFEIDSKAWPGLEETAASSPAKHHVRTFLKIISEEDSESSKERSDQELALTKAVDSMVVKRESASASASASAEATKEKERECYSKLSYDKMHKQTEETIKTSEDLELTDCKVKFRRKEICNQSNTIFDAESLLANIPITYQQKLALLFELLSACVADTPEDSNGSPRLRKGYDARHRTGLRLLATWLEVEWIKMEALETMVACSALAIKEEAVQSEKTESENSTWSNWKRGGIIGAAALTGGTLMAITGGLAAPAIASGLSAIAPTLGSLVPLGASGFAAVASAAGSAAGSVAVAASFGAAGAGLSGCKMARRIGEIEEFEFKTIGENHNQGRLAVGILISGFVLEEEDFIRPWKRTNDSLERYALQWESEILIALSTAVQDWLTSKLTRELMKQGAMMTVLSTLVSALAWPTALLQATDFIDSKWSIAIDRSDKAGTLLAEVLTRDLQGSRPVTLVGYSLGARVIFKCLQQLAVSGNNEGLVERVILLGAPISLKDEEWESARKMVAGRFVNVFSANDWILGVTFRASLLTKGLAGIQAVDVPGIENVDASHIIDGHSAYLWAAQQILQALDIDSYYPVSLGAAAGSKEEEVQV